MPPVGLLTTTIKKQLIHHSLHTTIHKYSEILDNLFAYHRNYTYGFQVLLNSTPKYKSDLVFFYCLCPKALECPTTNNQGCRFLPYHNQSGMQIPPLPQTIRDVDSSPTTINQGCRFLPYHKQSGMQIPPLPQTIRDADSSSAFHRLWKSTCFLNDLFSLHHVSLSSFSLF